VVHFPDSSRSERRFQRAGLRWRRRLAELHAGPATASTDPSPAHRIRWGVGLGAGRRPRLPLDRLAIVRANLIPRPRTFLVLNAGWRRSRPLEQPHRPSRRQLTASDGVSVSVPAGDHPEMPRGIYLAKSLGSIPVSRLNDAPTAPTTAILRLSPAPCRSRMSASTPPCRVVVAIVDGQLAPRRIRLSIGVLQTGSSSRRVGTRRRSRAAPTGSRNGT